MRARAACFVLLLLIAAVPGAIAPTSASSPPETVCGVCSDPFVDAATESGVELTIESSELTLQIDDDGTGYWTARVAIDEESATTFRENPALLDSVVRETFDQYRPFVDDPQNLTAQIEDNTVVVTFEVPEMGYRTSGGVLLVDYFNADGYTQRVYVDADRFVVSGPDGSVLVNDPSELKNDDDTAAVWLGDDHSGPYIDDETYLAFGPDRSLSTQAAATASIAADSAPYLLSDLVGAALVPTFLMGFGVVAIQRLTRRVDAESRSVRVLGYLTMGISVAWLFSLVAVRLVSGGYAIVAWTLGIQFALLGLLATKKPGLFTFRRLLVATLAPPIAAAFVVSFVTRPSLLWGVPSALSLGLTFALFLPFGYAARREHRTWPFALAIVAAPVVFTIPTLPIGGFGPAFMLLLLSGWTLLTLASGTLAYRLGWALGGESNTKSAPQPSGSHPQNHGA
ncbi:hypothetical protein [Haloferax sp. DFSO60]|uniref:hypothetical protein n=1 Tax=Haloferax sp. DFSO60 TaxID=3388652 RepID=UPI00397C46A4